MISNNQQIFLTSTACNYSYMQLGLMDFNARFYSPYLNRWTQPDTIIPDLESPQSWNRYSYVFNNPVKYNDPSGHCPWCIVGAVVGAAIGYGTQVYDNYQSGLTGSEAWTNVDAAPIVGGALIGSGAVILAPVAASAVSTGLAGVAVTTGSVGLMEASIAASTVSTGLATTLYGPISGTTTRAGGAITDLQNLYTNPMELLPSRTSLTDKTSGILLVDGVQYPLSSGWEGPAASIPSGTSGFDIVTRTHVEGHASALMQQNGWTEGTLFINNPPCTSCSRLLPRMLPGGSNLQIIGPDGFNEWFSGIIQ